MPLELSHLALATAVGAALLTFGALAAVGGRRTVRGVRDLGLGGLALALFAGVAAEGLSIPLAESAPYTTLFLPTVDLRAQALMQDADLRARTNVDPRLRYIPSVGGERVPNLESGYRLAGPLRTVEIPPLRHAAPTRLPRGVEPFADEGDPAALRREVAGLYDAARETAGPPDEGRADLARTASVGLLLLGLLGLVAGLLPLALRLLALAWDALRLLFATRTEGYRGARGRAVRAGARGLAQWHFGPARPFASLATFGLLALLGGIVMGFLREEEVRRAAHEVFAEARHLRVERGQRGSQGKG